MLTKLDPTEIENLLASRRAVFWDFDGVLLDSMAVRDDAFRIALADEPPDAVEKLLEFHRRNGGWSRYVKFRHYQTQILGGGEDEVQAARWAEIFSAHCAEQLGDPKRLISSTLAMGEALAGSVPMHIVSGSDGNELRKLCHQLGIDRLFRSIAGSPVPKTELIGRVLKTENYPPGDCMMIGDSRNDYDAAADHGIPFIAFRYHGAEPPTGWYWNEQ